MDAVTQKTFTDIYKTNGFKGVESLSGTGSSLEATERLRQFLPAILRACAAEVLLDAPCGDFYWMRCVDLGGVRYVGVDIVRDLIDANKEKCGDAPLRFFLHLDLIEDRLPKSSVVLCRDCLPHMCFTDALRALSNFKRSGAEHLLTTTYTGRASNASIRTGQWTPYNLRLPPFDLPVPTLLLNEDCRDYYPGFTDKCLGLWRLSEVPG